MRAAERRQIESRLSETKRLFFTPLVAVEINATFDEFFDYMEIAIEKYVSELLDRRHNHW